MSSVPPPQEKRPVGSPTEMSSGPAPESVADQLPLSPTVQQAVREVGSGPISVTELIETILRLHSSNYLVGAQLNERQWPTDDVRQPSEDWIRELRRLIRSDQPQIPGRFAVAGLCLLEPSVAEAAQDSGLLYAIAKEADPKSLAFLSEEGLRLLCVRAPIVAWGFRRLEPILHQSLVGSLESAKLALDQHAHLPANEVGRWALTRNGEIEAHSGVGVTKTFSNVGSVEMGWEAGKLAVFPLVAGDPADVNSNTSDERNFFLWNPADDTNIGGDWPAAIAAVVGQDGAAVVSVLNGQIWRGTDPRIGHSTDLRSSGPLGIAARSDRLAILESSSLLQMTSADGNTFVPVPAAGDPTALAANNSAVYIGGPDGFLERHTWADHENALVDHIDIGSISALEAGSRLVLAGGRRGLAIVNDKAVIAGQENSLGEKPVLAVAISDDNAAVGVVTADAIRIWRIDTVSDVQLTSYSSDAAEGPDLLNITPAVNALAALMTAKVVEPPVSIGLFGAWGSGKSFFMNALQDRITTVTREARDSERSQQSLWTWRNVAQVSFNAWTYSSADVWAGMIEQLISELARPEKPFDLPELEALNGQRIARLGAAERERTSADDRVIEARSAADTAEKRVTDAANTLISATQKVSEAKGAAATGVIRDEAKSAVAAALTKAGLSSAAVTYDQVRTELTNARLTEQSLSGLLKGAGRARLLVAALAGPLFGLLTWIALYFFAPPLSSGGAVLGVAAGWVAMGAGWLRDATAGVNRRIAVIEEAERTARRAQQTAQDEVTSALDQQRDAKQEQSAAEIDLAQKMDLLQVARSAVEGATTGSLLQEYLEGRNSSQDYRSQLGLIGTVRSDMKVLSGAVIKHNGEIAHGAAGDDVVSRIVLYVDDLDRCAPAAVVKVLEAVHLLLSYPIFIVVVAVDARWVSRSLATVYPTLLGDQTFTPDQYLEKIFQLPVWLDSPPAETASSMARRLLDPVMQIAPSSPVTTTTPSVETAHASAAPTTAITENRLRQTDLATSPPESVLIAPDEVESISRLAPLLTRSPRALKRYLNTYRLLKAFVDVDELPVARVLLAIATGRTGLGESMLNRIAGESDEVTLAMIVKDWSEADKRWLATYPDDQWLAATCGSVRPIVEHVRRFVFRSTSSERAGKGRHTIIHRDPNWSGRGSQAPN